MPPRGRGRGRGGGRWANRAATTRGGSRVAKTTPKLIRARRNSLGNINGQYRDPNDAHGIHAIFEPPGLLIIAGLLPEHFPDYDSAQEDESDSHSDYGSATNKTPKKHQHGAKDRLHDTDDARHHASNPGNDDDWTETEVEVFVAPKTRGFYRPPAKREVVRKRVKRVESSRYNDGAPKSQLENADDDVADDDAPSGRSSQRSNLAIQDLPIIVEHGASDDDEPMDDAPASTEVKTSVSDAPTRDRRQRAKPRKDRPAAAIVDEGELSDSYFPDAFLKRPPAPPESHCEDRADWIMKKRFDPMGDPQAFITALTKIDPAKRSTDVLFDIAYNAQRALKAWQDEYLMLDLKTAPKSNPPKKPLTGGRNPIDPDIYDDMLEADLYGYNFDAKKPPGGQDPFRQRTGGGKFVNGRELRQRRGRDVGAVDLSEPEATDNGGYGTRRRRAAQRQNYNELQVPPPPRGVKRVNSTGPSEYEGPPRKRGRPSAAEKSIMQSRIRQLREESLAVSTSSEPDGKSPEPPRRRGRPPGSKNTQPRSDAGIKKGPRKSRLASTTIDSEDTSQNGLPERIETVTPKSHPSGEDPMVIDDVPPAMVNGTTDPVVAQEQKPIANGQTLAPTQERTTAAASAPAPNIESLKDKDPKKRVRSEKRSKSMTEWWAARKAKAAEDRKLQLAQQAEADRIAEEQARAAHAAHQAQFPPQDARYWPQIAPQHPQQQYPGPPPAPNHVSGPPSQVPQQGPSQNQPQNMPPAPPQHYHHQQGPHPPAPRQDPHHIPPPLPAGHPQGLPMQGLPPPPQGPLPHQQHHLHGSAQGHQPGHPQGIPQEAPRQEMHRQEMSRQEIPRQEMSHQEMSRQEMSRQEMSRQEMSRQEMPRQEMPRQDMPRQEMSRQDISRQDISRHEMSRQEMSRQEMSRQELSRQESPRGPPPPSLIHHTQPQHRAPSVSFAGSPPQPQPPQQHVFHHHSSALPPPPSTAQYSPPPPPPAVSASQTPSQVPARQPSPLRRIINYVSDPSKAAQPSGPPYQSIMTPGASSPTIIQHHGHPSRPSSRGRTPPASAGSFMGAFHINSHSSRPPIPGTGSFRPDTPGKSSFTNYSAPSRPQGRMTGAQVQDLALAAVQPVQRKPIEDVLKEQREWKVRNPSPPAPSDRPRVLFKLQPMPANEGAVHQQQQLPPSSAHPSDREPPPPLHHQREHSASTLPSIQRHISSAFSHFGPPLPDNRGPLQQDTQGPRQPQNSILHHHQHQHRPSFGDNHHHRPSLPPSASASANPTTGPQQLPSLAKSISEWERQDELAAAGIGRHRSVSTSSHGRGLPSLAQQPLRYATDPQHSAGGDAGRRGGSEGKM